MDKLPFTVYDFFGYLASGFILLVSIAAAFTHTISWQATPDVIICLLLIVVAYAAGQVIANVSGYLLESIVVGRWLGRPAANLMRETTPNTVGARLFPGYYKALPSHQQHACLTRSGMQRDGGEALFYEAFAVVKQDSSAMDRLNTFLNLYGFCRNMAISLLIAAICLTGGSLLGRADTGNLISPGWCAAAAGGLAIGLFYRYLKFLRNYSVEVFVTYGASS